ncbi:MAG: 2-oxoglutarate carboxylase large subunit [Smithella sp. PtaU1.Bin162]|nr:MAG: 2-oxoglutarate carboxylase large subunit [Smithella sp. PtaU1.Bin162]
MVKEKIGSASDIQVGSCTIGGCTAAADNGPLKLVDETLRDGTQSLWGMMISYHMFEPVLREISEVGYDQLNLPHHPGQPTVSARFFKEDPRLLYKLWRDKLKDSKTIISTVSMGMSLEVAGPAENKTMVSMYYRQCKEWLPQLQRYMLMCCTEDEIKNTFPVLFPMFRSLGIEPIPYMAIGHSPRHNEEFYTSRVKHIVEKYKPISICIKDVDGLLVAERIRKLVPAMQAAADGTPLEIHMHGMNGEQSYNAVVAMELGIRKITTCIPPLAYGSSHVSVYNVVKNAEQMGIPHNIDLEKVKVIEDRLRRIAKAYGHPVDVQPLPFDLQTYKHQVPGGVISNTTTQLAQLGLQDKLQDVLEEIPLILKELGYPIMITPFSQFIVTQAVLNVQLGRWVQCIDALVEFAAGIYGIEESGVNHMDQNLKDKLLSLPPAKRIQKIADNLVANINSEPSEAECKKRFGLPPDADLETWALRVVMKGDEDLKNVTPGGPESYRKYL